MSSAKGGLSQALQGMKFMQRGAHGGEDRREPSPARPPREAGAKQPAGRRAAAPRFVYAAENVATEGFLGRRSFGGFNAPVEATYNEHLKERRQVLRDRRPDGRSPSDRGMLERIEKLIESGAPGGGGKKKKRPGPAQHKKKKRRKGAA